jgi:hypothetical protein
MEITADSRVIQNSRGILRDTSQEGVVPEKAARKVSGPKTTIINPANSLSSGGLLLALTAVVTFLPVFSLMTVAAGGSKAPLAIQLTTLDNRMAPKISMGANGKFGWTGSSRTER